MARATAARCGRRELGAPRRLFDATTRPTGAMPIIFCVYRRTSLLCNSFESLAAATAAIWPRSRSAKAAAAIVAAIRQRRHAAEWRSRLGECWQRRLIVLAPPHHRPPHLHPSFTPHSNSGNNRFQIWSPLAMRRHPRDLRARLSPFFARFENLLI